MQDGMLTTQVFDVPRQSRAKGPQTPVRPCPGMILATGARPKRIILRPTSTDHGR
jgi:hypothetical protein